MKTMTCLQLGGACEKEFHAETFAEMAELSKKHAMEMFQQGDQAHLDAMKKMQSMMKTPEDMQQWMQECENAFNQLSNH